MAEAAQGGGFGGAEILARHRLRPIQAQPRAAIPRRA